jgi:hypothetical protein
MANAPKLANEAVNAGVDAITALANGGSIKIYSGTKPADADTAPGGGNVLLATLGLANPAFGAAVAGVATANTITDGTGSAGAGAAPGTAATWFRVTRSNGNALWDGTVGTAGCDLTISTANIFTGQSVSGSGLTYTQGKG